MRHSPSAPRSLQAMSSALFSTLRLFKQAILRFSSQILYHAHTAALFTVSDLKTIFFPIVRVYRCSLHPPLLNNFL